MRGDAEPTWCTWISALGRSAMNAAYGEVLASDMRVSVAVAREPVAGGVSLPVYETAAGYNGSGPAKYEFAGPRSCPARSLRRDRALHLGGQLVDRRVGHGLAVDLHRGCGVDAVLRCLFGSVVDPLLEGAGPDGARHRGAGGAGLHRVVEQLPVAEPGGPFLRLVLEQQVVELLGRLRTRGVQHRGVRIGRPRRVVAGRAVVEKVQDVVPQ